MIGCWSIRTGTGARHVALQARNQQRQLYQHNTLLINHTIKPVLVPTSTGAFRKNIRSPETNFKQHQQNIRWYRGDSGDAVTNLSVKETELLKIARPKDEEIRKNHVKPVSIKNIPNESLGTNEAGKEDESTNVDALELEIRRKRLIYRAKQRGWLEVDLLLGTWAYENVPNLDGDELDEFEEFVNIDTIDIYNVLTLRVDIPIELQNKEKRIAERIQDWARNSPLGKADPEKYKEVKTKSNLT